jgi:hypothetical protein
MEESTLVRAVEAARTAAAELGLQVDDAVVVTNSNRITVRLLPCDVLARVAPAADRAYSEFEVDVARRLADVDGPVGLLDPRVYPRVYLRGSFAISLWTYYETSGSEIVPTDYADALMRYHAALRQVDLQAPHVTDRIAGALRELSDREQTPELLDPDRELLSNALSSLSAVVSHSKSPEQLIHGEPHAGNLLNTRSGPLFVDLADCCRGPIEFDLAATPDDVADYYAGADQELTRQCRILTQALVTTWRWRRDDQFPDRSRWRMQGLNEVRAGLEREGLA